MQHSMRQIKDNNRPWVHFWALLLLSLGLLCSNNLAAQGRIENLPDFTQIVEETESSEVIMRSDESVPVRSVNGFDEDPYDFLLGCFGPDATADRGPQQPRQEPEEQIVPRGVGYGFVISDDGYILTNNHLVADAQDIYVTFVDGEEYSAEVVGTDERTDVALRKLDAKDLQHLPIVDSKELNKRA